MHRQRVAVRAGETSPAALQSVAQAYAEKWGTALPSTVSGQSNSLQATGVVRDAWWLSVPHVGQAKSYYCGPASGKMIVAYLNEGRSAYDNATQTQAHMASRSHMSTDFHGKTGWDSGFFKIGLNRWREGSSTGFYVDRDSPSPSEFRNALAFDVDNGYPFAADTVEWAGGAHYNGHPQNSTIGHWIVVNGYANWSNTTYFVDPSTTVWAGVGTNFEASTTYFVNTYLQQNGITW